MDPFAELTASKLFFPPSPFASVCVCVCVREGVYNPLSHKLVVRRHSRLSQTMAQAHCPAVYTAASARTHTTQKLSHSRGTGGWQGRCSALELLLGITLSMSSPPASPFSPSCFASPYPAASYTTSLFLFRHMVMSP